MELKDCELLRVRLLAGDMLAVSCPVPLSRACADNVVAEASRVLAEAGHPDVPVLILDAGISVEIVRPEKE